MQHIFKGALIMVPTLLAALLPLTGCGSEGDPAKPPQMTAAANKTPPADAVAVVNGKAITRADLEDFIAQRSAQRPGTQVNPEEILDEMISVVLLSQEAERQGLDRKPEVQKQLDRARSNVLVSTLVDQKVSERQFTEAEMRAEYDKQLPALKRTEYKARHILVETEEAAQDVLARLNKGEKFGDLAKSLSKDVGSGERGGDLGWFPAETMVKPFADAVRNLEKGAMTQNPVQTDFGWHIISLDDSREAEPPAFEALRGQIEQFMMTRHLQEFVNDLREKAGIERHPH